MDLEDAGGSAADDVVGESAAAELLEGLNPPQREAVQHVEGPLLILAGAGSGKTRVITRRVAWLLSAAGVRPHEIIAITFTNKAAREMRERVEALVPERGVWVSTFHSTCARILRREIEVLGGFTRNFTIYDTYDRNQLIKRIVGELGYDATRFRPQAIGAWISERKNEAPADGDVAEGAMEHEVFEAVEAAYGKTMRKNNALDFDDLLLVTQRIFRDHPGVRDAYARRFRFVMVDEYQDTNRVQYLLTRALASFHGNIAVCGDPDQSIYAWRGADLRNILDFEEDFGAAKVIKLEQNYRSTGNILKAAQGLIAQNQSRKEKDLWTDRGDGEKVGVVVCADENDEGDEIARQVRTLLESGRRADECAVFYRANFMQRALERALRLASIPYQIVGGLEFYARKEIKDLISYLHLLVNPADDVACARVLNVPQRGVGDKSVLELAAWAAERGVPLLAACGSDEALGVLRGRAKKGAAEFARTIAELAPLASAPAAEALERVIVATGYDAYLEGLADAEQTMRAENVVELLAHAATYDGESPEGRLMGFLQDVALVSDVDTLEEDVAKVTLMTLHSAKGLEFPFVFVVGLEEELLPHARSVTSIEGVEEERRLLYVGMTRAMEQLVLLRAEWRFHFGQSMPRVASRFLEEIPAQFVEGTTFDEEDDDVLGAFEAPSDVPGLAVGAWVRHAAFGTGLVEGLSGSGINARATVRFARHGTKLLLLQYAKLEVTEAP